MECPRCEGFGLVLRGADASGGRMFVPCGDCAGTGVVVTKNTARGKEAPERRTPPPEDPSGPEFTYPFGSPRLF